MRVRSLCSDVRVAGQGAEATRAGPDGAGGRDDPGGAPLFSVGSFGLGQMSHLSGKAVGIGFLMGRATSVGRSSFTSPESFR